MEANRIPAYSNKSPTGMLHWFTEMMMLDLLMHPDDDPAEIVSIKDGTPIFNEVECETIRHILSEMFDEFGDQVYGAAHPVFMHVMGIQVEPLWPTL